MPAFVDVIICTRDLAICLSGFSEPFVTIPIRSVVGEPGKIATFRRPAFGSWDVLGPLDAAWDRLFPTMSGM